MRAKAPRKGGGRHPPARRPGGRSVPWGCRCLWRQMRQWHGASRGRSRRRSIHGGGGHCHLAGGEGGRWPNDVGPSGGLGGALLGRWAEPAIHGCGGLAAGSGSNLAATTILITRPCPPIPFNTCGWPFGGRGCCSSLAAHGCPCSHSASCWGAPVGGPGEQLEAPGPRWGSAGGGHGKGGVAGSPPRPR